MKKPWKGPEADKQDVKEAEKAPILVNLKEAKANKEQEITVKEEAEVKEEPDSEPELTIVESKPDMTEEEKEEEESKQRLREALALVMEDYESAESDEEEYYWSWFILKESVYPRLYCSSIKPSLLTFIFGSDQELQNTNSFFRRFYLHFLTILFVFRSIEHRERE